MNDHYKLMEEKIGHLKALFDERLTDHYRVNIDRALTHGEYGLALEYLLDSLDEGQIEISREIFDEIDSCVSAMGLTWDDLPEISDLVR